MKYLVSNLTDGGVWPISQLTRVGEIAFAQTTKQYLRHVVAWVRSMQSTHACISAADGRVCSVSVAGFMGVTFSIASALKPVSCFKRVTFEVRRNQQVDAKKPA